MLHARQCVCSHFCVCVRARACVVCMCVCVCVCVPCNLPRCASPCHCVASYSHQLHAFTVGAPQMQSRETVLAKATEEMFEKWGAYIKGEVMVRACTAALCVSYSTSARCILSSQTVLCRIFV